MSLDWSRMSICRMSISTSFDIIDILAKRRGFKAWWSGLDQSERKCAIEEIADACIDYAEESRP